jgi:hypothetical protein
MFTPNNTNTTISAVKAKNVSSHLIGRALLVDGIGVGTLSGYKRNRFSGSITLYAGGNIRKVSKSAHIVY